MCYAPTLGVKGYNRKTATRPICINTFIKTILLKTINSTLREGVYDSGSEICLISARYRLPYIYPEATALEYSKAVYEVTIAVAKLNVPCPTAN